MTRVSLCRDRVFPGVGHSFGDIRLYVVTGFPRVVLRQDVFLSGPTGQVMSLKVIHFQSIFLIYFFLKKTDLCAEIWNN